MQLHSFTCASESKGREKNSKTQPGSDPRPLTHEAFAPLLSAKQQSLPNWPHSSQLDSRHFLKSEILTWINRTIRHLGDDLQQRLHRVVGQLVDVERPRRGPGAGADAEPRISRFDVGVVVELDFEVGDPRGERLADEDIVLKR